MGADLPHTSEREIEVTVEGQDPIAMVELLRNNRVIERHFPEDTLEEASQLRGKAKCRIQYGWGPWADLDMGRICQWDMTIKLEKGRFLKALQCFQSAPFEETLRDRMRVVSPQEIHLQSNTTRENCYGEDPTKALVLTLDADPEAVLEVELRQPSKQVISTQLSSLLDDNVVTFTGVFTTESYILHRLVGPSDYAATVRWTDSRRDAEPGDYYYVRVHQRNGHLAWSSPVWVG